VLITNVSRLSGIERTLDIPVTKEQLQRWRDGELIQRAMPHLTATQREFLMTGITDEEWSKAFPPEEEEGDTINPETGEEPGS